MANQLLLDTVQLSTQTHLAAHANKAHLDHQARQVMTVRRVRTETLEVMATKERKDKCSPALCHQRSRASSAPLDRKDLSGNLDQRDLQDLKANPLTRPTMERRENKACQDHKVFQDQSVHPEPQDPRDNQAALFKSTDQLDQPESVVLQEELARRDNQAAMDSKAHKAHRERQAPMAEPDLKEMLAHLDPSDLRESLAQRELATTAHHHALHLAIKPPTERFSTRDPLQQPTQIVHRLLSLLLILLCQKSNQQQRTKSNYSHSRTS